MTIRRALLSVSDKAGLADFARGLAAEGVDLVASGGTARALADAGLTVTSVETLTGLAPVLDGRVKTLHPAIHAGILARDTDEDRAALSENGWEFIDLVVVNLYPFVETVASPGVTLAEAVEQIDIGGVALIRAAAKNFARVAVVVDPADYDRVLKAVRQGGSVPPGTRRELAEKAFATTAAYDTNITQYLLQIDEKTLPPGLAITLPQAQTLRYGENPHQQAALYAPPGVGPLGGELLQGKPLSYNNLLDIDAAWAAAESFGDTAVVVVKHLSPCGIAVNPDLAEAFRRALASDPVSAFGGVVASNRPFDGPTAEALGDLFVEAIAAPSFTAEALDVLDHRPNCRLLQMKVMPAPGFTLRSVRAGLLAQTPDPGDDAQWRIVTERAPNDVERAALEFAWQAVMHVKSNAIVLAKDGATVGVGGGLPSRVDAARLAIEKAGDQAPGSVMASDAFFPFPDGLEVAAEAGVTAVVEPGGSIRDEVVIDAANKLGLAMCFTGVRHFKH
jgi:phosphoribosylaminoimidazolecarboxamide formyltransferase/IMP cyclohydrolase